MLKSLFTGLLKVVYCFFILAILNSCQEENNMDCFKSTGDIITTTRDAAPFADIYLEDNVEVVLVQDSVYFLELTAGENLQANVLTEIRDNALYISNINKCNWVRSYRKQIVLKVHTPDVLNIYHNGFSTLRTEGRFNVDTLFLHITGAGDADLDVTSNQIWMDMYEFGNVYFKGSVNELNATVAGFGKLIAPDFEITNAHLLVSDGGDATLKINNGLYATLTGLGNVYYYGKPEILVVDRFGEGQVIKKE